MTGTPRTSTRSGPAVSSRAEARSMISVTDRAADQVRALLAAHAPAGTGGGPEEAGAGYGLRLGVDWYGWAHRYRLSLAPEPATDEVVVAAGGVAVFVPAGAVTVVDGLRIDYVDGPAGAGFTFHNPRPGVAGPPVDAPAGSGRPPGGDEADRWDRIGAAMAGIRPYLQAEGGDVTVVAVHGGTVVVSLTGACSGCGAAGLTVAGMIETRLRAAVPDIDRVVLDGTPDAIPPDDGIRSGRRGPAAGGWGR